jgi:hypothetical protein
MNGVRHGYRTFVGFLLGPIVPGILFACDHFIEHGMYWKQGVILSLSLSAFFGYPVAIAWGIPLFLLMKRMGWSQLYHYIPIGAGLGVIAAFFADSDKLQYSTLAEFARDHAHHLFFLGPIMGMIATLSFWLIARPDHPEKDT